MKKMKKNIMIIQIVLSNVFFVVACYFLQKNVFSDQNIILVCVAYLLILCVFILNNYMYFRSYKTIKKEEKK